MVNLSDNGTNQDNEYNQMATSTGMSRRHLIQIGGGLAVVAAVAGTGHATSRGSASSANSVPVRHAAHQATPPAGAIPQLGEQADGTRIWRVKVGGMDTENQIDVHAFLPGEITVNAGDAVWFEFSLEMPGAHTVTFASGAEAPTFEIPDPDATPTAGPPTLIANPEVLFPIGGPAYDGTGYVNSGVDFLRTPDMPPFMLTFTEPGRYEYVCALHKLVMKGTVIVQDADAELPMDQADYDALAEEQFAAVVAAGRSAIEQFADAVPTERPDGTTLWEMTAGAGGEAQARVMRFLPDTLEIGVGDTIRWVDRSVGEPHTVTFLGGEEAPELNLIEPQPAGPPKLIFNELVILPQGDGEYDGTGYTNSGFLSTPITNSDSYEVTFTAAGEFDYLCVIHEGMKGKVLVR